MKKAVLLMALLSLFIGGCVVYQVPPRAYVSAPAVAYDQPCYGSLRQCRPDIWYVGAYDPWSVYPGGYFYGTGYYFSSGGSFYFYDRRYWYHNYRPVIIHNPPPAVYHYHQKRTGGHGGNDRMREFREDRRQYNHDNHPHQRNLIEDYKKDRRDYERRNGKQGR